MSMEEPSGYCMRARILGTTSFLSDKGTSRDDTKEISHRRAEVSPLRPGVRRRGLVVRSEVRKPRREGFDYLLRSERGRLRPTW
jgi:hypothetical protein